MPSEEKSTLDGLFSGLVAETPDVQVRGDDYVRNGVVFAVRRGPNSIELRLGPDIAEAAMRTPGATQSSRGAEWVRLETPDWAEATDRVVAWYRVAWRLAAKSR